MITILTTHHCPLAANQWAGRKNILLYISVILSALFLGCKSAPKEEANPEPIPLPVQASLPESPSPPSLTCLFAGDIMAHEPNYRMKDYSRIWTGIKSAVSSCDLAFANIEMPIDDAIPMSTYPEFNVHSPYAEAAIDAGFNVFSLVNNHTNDQGLKGMEATRKWAAGIAAKSAAGNRPLYFSGLKENAAFDMSYAVIEKNGFRVLFLAVTEILNRGDYKRYMNYIGIDEASRAMFIDKVKALRNNNPCDIFVLAVHANVPEYVHTIAQSRKAWYRDLLAAGVDVLWANHPHIVQDVVTEKGKIIMYACGNTISAQRSKAQFSSPRTERDYTGDGLMLKAVFKRKTESECRPPPPPNRSTYTLESIEPIFITTYITSAGEYVIKMLNDDTIQQLNDGGQTKWAKYLAERKKIMEEVTLKRD